MNQNKISSEKEIEVRMSCLQIASAGKGFTKKEVISAAMMMSEFVLGRLDIDTWHQLVAENQEQKQEAAPVASASIALNYE